MRSSIPRSPFSTPLSGSAREAELRLRSMFQWRGLRAPRWLAVLAAAVILLCGSLISCRERYSAPAVVMELQYYDVLGNYVEIPALALPQGEADEGAEAVNRELSALVEEYRAAIAQIPEQQQAGDWFRCLCYPTLTDRYLSLVLFQYDQSAASGLAGASCSLSTWVYHRQEGRLVPQDEAWRLAGTDLEAVRAQLEETIAADPSDDWSLEEVRLAGFRVGGEDQVTLYLSSVHSSAHGVEIGRLYQWQAGTISQYPSPGETLDEQPLVPPEETLDLSPALWCRWYKEDGVPEEGWDPVPMSEGVQNYQLARRAIEFYELLYGVSEYRLLSYTQGSRTLLLVESAGAPHVAGLDNLVLGVWDEEIQDFVGDPFVLGGDQGLWSAWEGDGALWLLCSNSVTYQGDETASGLGLFRFAGGTLERVVTLSQQALDCGVLPDGEETRCLLYPLASDTREGLLAQDFWLSRLAVPGLGGFDLYEKNPAYDPYRPTADGEAQWQYVGFVPLDSPSDAVRSQAGADTRAAYAQTLEELLVRGRLPDGSQLESPILTASPASGYADQFAVSDVDGDGREELLLSLRSTITADQGTYVLDYDGDAGGLRLQTQAPDRLGLTPTFYENGTVLSPWSHNQGLANRFWPYDVYRYQPGTDTYQFSGSADAWERAVSDQNPDLPAFPEELDQSGSGFLYYLDGDTDTPVDQAVYLQWLEEHTGGTSPLPVQWRGLTRGNIQRLREWG